MKSFVLSLLLTLLCLCPGCGLLWSVEQPRARVTEVALEDQSDHGARILVSVALSNPNDVALPLVNAGYTMRVNGASEATYADLPNRTLPALGQQIVTLPVGLSLGSGTSPRGASYLVHGSGTYEPPGEIRKLLTEARVPLPSTSFSASGTLD